MTALDDAFAAFRVQVNAYGQTQYTQGKADQSLTDAAALASVQAQLEAAEQADTDLQAKFDMEQAALVALQAAFDQYKVDNPPTTPPPPPPPPPTTFRVGLNYSSTASIASANAASEPKAQAARIFVDAGRTNINQEPEYVRAVNNGVDTFIFSWKDTSVPAWLKTVPKTVKRWYGVAHHEPEDMTATAWKALQTAHMPAVRAAGGVPAFIFTNFGLKNANLRDWVCPDGTHDAGGTDYYPDKAPNMTQAQCVALWKSAMKTFGVSRWIIGEYGVIATDPKAVANIKEIKTLLPDVAEVACYWSSQASGKPDYRLSTATAAAWFA